MLRRGFIRSFAKVPSLEAALGVAEQLGQVLGEHARVGQPFVEAYYKEEGWFEIAFNLAEMDFPALRMRLADSWTGTGTHDDPSDIWNPEAHWNQGTAGFAVPHIVWVLLEALPEKQ